MERERSSKIKISIKNCPYQPPGTNHSLKSGKAPLKHTQPATAHALYLGTVRAIKRTCR